MGNYFLDILEYRQYLILIEEKKYFYKVLSVQEVVAHFT